MKRIASFLMSALFCAALMMAPVQANAEKVLHVASDTNEMGVTTFNPHYGGTEPRSRVPAL